MNTIITGNPTASGGVTTNDGLRRARVLLASALVPITLSILLYGLFYMLGDYKVVERATAKSDFAAISFPERRKPVEQVFTATGTLTSLPENTTAAYLMVQRDKAYWPKKALGSNPADWSQEIDAVRIENSIVSMVVIAVGAEGKAQLDQWYEASEQTGKYPGIAEVVTSKEIARVKVTQQ